MTPERILERICATAQTSSVSWDLTVQTVLRLWAFSNHKSWDYYLGEIKDLSESTSTLQIQLGMRLDNLMLKKDVLLFCDVLCRDKENFA